jgi:hypothetical protein
MGWTYTTKPGTLSPVDFIKQCCWRENQQKLIAGAQVGNTVYFAIKTEPKDYIGKIYQPDGEGKVTGALVYLVDTKAGSDGFNFGWKDMDETMGPYDEGKCPAAILKLLSPLKPDAPSYAKQWRERQKAWASVSNQQEMAI